MSSWARGGGLLLLAAAAGCGRGAGEPAGSVLLNIRFAADVPGDRVAATRSLAIAVDGAGSFKATEPVAGQFAAGTVTVRYRPGVAAGTLHFTATASDGAGAPIGSGETTATIDPHAEAMALIVLAAKQPPV